MDSTCLADRDTVIVKDDPFSGRPPRLLSDRLIPISELVERAEIDPEDADLVRVFMNGEEIMRPLWPFVIARGHVEIAVVPQGGDGDKVLRTLLTIAVVVAAFYVGGVAASAFGLEAGTAAYSAVSAGVAGITSTVGQLAINAILPPPKLSGNYAADPDPVYFINGARNQLALNQPIHTVLGRHRVFPRLLSRPYPEIRGEDSYYYVVLDYGPLGVEISDRKVGDTPIGELDGVEYQERLTASDPHPTMASRQVIADPVGATLGPGDWEGRRTASDTADCDLILLFPQGLGKVNDKGKPRSHSVSIQVRYREVIDPGPGETFGPWQFASQALPGRIPFRNFDDQFTGLESYEGGQLGNFTFTATKPGEPFYRQIGFSFPSAGTWDVQVQRVGEDGEITDKIYDDMRLEQILSKRDEPAVQSDDVAYGVFRLKATDETSGAVDTLNMVLGRLIPSFPDAVLDQSDLSGVTASDLSELTVSSNPWEQTAWIARNGFYARRPYADSEIDWPSLAAAAKDARDRGKRFDYVVTADISSEDLMAMAGFAGEGRPYRFNNVFKAHVDRPQPAPTHYFREGTARNISVTVSWPQEVHAYRVTFNDADDGWRQREVIVYVDGYTKETATRIEPFSIAGKTHWDDLHESLQQHYRNSRAQKELMRCEVPADKVDNTLEPMAWVSVATRVLAQARDSGVIREVFTNGSGQVIGLKLDQPIAQGPSQAALSLKWVRQDDDSPAIFSPAAFLLDVPASDTVSPEIVFDTPLAGASAPQAGDEWVVGPSGVELFEGLLDKAEDVSEGWLRLYLKSYAVARFDDTGFSVPDYAPAYDLPVTPVPPRPVFELSTADERRIIVRFSFPDGFAAQISHFRVWRADAPPADDDNPGVYGLFESLPDLPGTARAIVDGARSAGDRVVYRVQAIGKDGTAGPILETGVINAADDIGQPQDVTVTPGTETGPQGASKPVFSVSFTPDPRLALLDAVIAIRQVVFSGGVRVDEASQPAFEQGFIVDPAAGKGVVRGITAGGTYDLRVYFRGRRGEVGDPVTILNVVAPATDTAITALDAAEDSQLRGLLDDLEASADTALDDAADALAAAALAGDAANTATQNYQALSADFTTLEGVVAGKASQQSLTLLSDELDDQGQLLSVAAADIDSLTADYGTLSSQVANHTTLIQANADDNEATLLAVQSLQATANAIKQARIPSTFEDGFQNLTPSTTGKPGQVATLQASSDYAVTTGDGQPVIQVTNYRSYSLKYTQPVTPNQVWEVEIEWRSTILDPGKSRLWLFIHGLNGDWSQSLDTINDGAIAAASQVDVWQRTVWRFTNDPSLASDPTIDAYHAMTNWEHLRLQVIHNAINGTGRQQARAIRFENVTTDQAVKAAFTSAQQALASETQARVTAFQAFDADLGDLTATVQIQAAAIASVEGAAAYYSIEVGASGSDPAIASFRAGKNGSAIGLAAKVLRLINIVGGGSIEVMRAVGGYIFFSNPISIDKGSRRVTLGPNANLVLWFGSNSINPPSQTVGNSIFALATDGNIYYGGSVLKAAVNFTATYNASPVNNNGSGATFSTGTISINTSGLAGSKTYSTEIVSSSNLPPKVSVVNPTSAGFSLQASGFLVGESETGVVRSIVTDETTGQVTTEQAAYSLTRTS